ncbi:porin [Oxalicibacterium flavum]|uniref:Porin n=1 Tax=Oxalicibacterium flavum TaxID=179467 RepID=A0A8J2UNQ7_9BURK|nr:porin [Oxalicibacterium flavum]GGC14878.1 porin [Oxalicibacterium flavum]
MKKSLLALAVLGAFAGAASAQSSVTVYGIVDTGIGSVDINNGGERTTGLTSGAQSPSRIGFKGTEDLGGGLKANFQLEAGFNSDNGGSAASNQIFNRVATVGLSGAFGKVDLGRQTTILKDAHDQIDPFGGSGSIGNIARIFYNGGVATNGAAVGDRVSNTIKYQTNSYSGFKAGAAYTFGEQEGDNGAQRQYGVGLGYANGPLNVQFAYNNVNADTATGGVVTPVGEAKIAFIGATYNFGAFKLHGAYADGKFESNAGGTDVKYRNGLIGVSLPLGPGSLAASYAINDNRTFDDADSQQVAIQYSYDLSKRTNLYAGYARTNNDIGAALGGSQLGSLNVTNASVGGGQDVSIIAVGIRHKF